MDSLAEKLKKAQLLERKLAIKAMLPHLYGMKWYTWARQFYESTNRYNFCCSANQVGKSSAQIRKCVNWATDRQLWPKLWRRRPLQFWYLYPTKTVATTEVMKKWIPEWLPREDMKEDPVYGWDLETKNKEVSAIHFKSGVSVYFRTYEQDVQHLQSGSVDAIFCDEELPSELFDELNMRIAATDGYFHMVFTATLGQDFWRETIECKGRSERFKDAFKVQISMYECIKYEDGTSSHWTVEKIERIKNSCGTEAEVQRRVYGRFVVSEGLKYPSFSRLKNVKPYHHLPKDWLVYSGLDYGSGGAKGHPSAIVFIAVNPEFTKARVFKGWRGDGIQTTAQDLLQKYVDLRGNIVVAGAFYDWQCRDLATFASRVNEPLIPAEKSHESGEQILNVLFKNEILIIYDLEELEPLVNELTSLQKATNKTKAKDDYCDALRYAVTRIPWDFSVIKEAPIRIENTKKSDVDLRREAFQSIEEQYSILVEDEIDEWNDLYEP